MRKTLTSILAITLASFFPTVASAQDWTGPYGGVTFGYSLGDATHSFDNGAPTGNYSPDGVLFGGFFGYGFQTGNFVIAAEVDAEINNASGSFVNTTFPTSGGSFDGGLQASARAVVGIPVEIAGNPALVYATGGLALGRFDFLGGPAVAPNNRYTDTVLGWTAGAGVDWRLDEMATLRIEYRYTDFGTASGTLSPAFPGVTMPVDMTQHAIRVGLRFDF